MRLGAPPNPRLAAASSAAAFGGFGGGGRWNDNAELDLDGGAVGDADLHQRQMLEEQLAAAV